MNRTALYAICASFVCCPGVAFCDEPTEMETAFQNTLRIQQAMEKARFHLFTKAEAHKAVAILEQNLPGINGNGNYLKLMRNAYQSYIHDLWLANRNDIAKLYLERLKILDPAAAQQMKRRAVAAPVVQETTIPKKKEFTFPVLSNNQKKQPVVPAALAVQTGNPSAKPTPPAPSKARAKLIDPFDSAFELRKPFTQSENNPSQKLLDQAEKAFAQRQFEQARQLYAKAFQSGLGFSQETRERWAYCKMHFVVEQINTDTISRQSLLPLRKQVEQAMAMAPRLSDTGQWLLKEMDKRSTRVTPAKNDTFSLRHLGEAARGWQLTETDHFHIYHAQSRETVERIAKAAESTRLAMYRKWFGQNGEPWQPKCVLYLYSTANGYQKNTGAPKSSPGHSRIEIDKDEHKVVSRKIHAAVNSSELLSSTLPKEITHVVMAGQFGNFHAPLWADVGMAGLSGPSSRIAQYQRSLHSVYKSEKMIRLAEMIQAEQYPVAEKIPAYFAQSVFLVQWLSNKKGPIVFTQFLRDSLHHGYATALQKHYQIADMQELETAFQRQVLNDVQNGDSWASK